MKRVLILVFLLWTTQSYSQSLSNFSIFGYADAQTSFSKKTISFSVSEFSPVFEYRYGEDTLFRANLLFQTLGDSSTKTDLNFLIFDFVLSDNLILEFGKFPSPIGQFQQNLRPSWINTLPTQPHGFDDDLSVGPRHGVGIQLKGNYHIHNSRFLYSLFITNGPELQSSLGQIVISDDEINDSQNLGKLFGMRVGVNPILDLEAHVSLAAGRIGLGTAQNRSYKLIGGDFVYRDTQTFLKGIGLRGEYLASNIELTSSSVREESAWYLEGSYLHTPSHLQLVSRFGQFATKVDNPQIYSSSSQISTHARINTKYTSYGVNYIFHPSVIFKLAYEVEYHQGNTPRTTINSQIVAGF